MKKQIASDRTSSRLARLTRNQLHLTCGSTFLATGILVLFPLSLFDRVTTSTGNFVSLLGTPLASARFGLRGIYNFLPRLWCCPQGKPNAYEKAIHLTKKQLYMQISRSKTYECRLPVLYLFLRIYMKSLLLFSKSPVCPCLVSGFWILGLLQHVRFYLANSIQTWTNQAQNFRLVISHQTVQLVFLFVYI